MQKKTLFHQTRVGGQGMEPYFFQSQIIYEKSSLNRTREEGPAS